MRGCVINDTETLYVKVGEVDIELMSLTDSISLELFDTSSNGERVNVFLDVEQAIQVRDWLNETMPPAVGQLPGEAPPEARNQLVEALERINEYACYASEENTDAREAMLLRIGETARSAISTATEQLSN